MTLRIGSMCSGYGGLDLAVHEVLGGELAWVADNDPGASAILAHRFPSVPNLGDITAVDWSAVEPVDILCAGTPCQDVSQAGARAGLKAGTRSGVWLEAVRAIAVLQPRLVLIENVRGLLSARGDDPTAEHLRAEAARDVTARLLDWLENAQAIALAKGDMRRVRECRKRTARVMGLRKRAVARCQWHERRLVRAIGTVLGSLASLGFDAEGVVVSAAEAGAPHQRDRVFILAWPAADTRGRELQRRGIPRVLGSAPAGELGEGNQWERTGNAAGNGGPAAEDADRAAGGERRLAAPGQAAGGRTRADAGGPGGVRVAANADDELLAAHRRGVARGSAGGQRRNPGPDRGPGDRSHATPAGADGDGRDEGRPEPARIVGGPDAAIGSDGSCPSCGCGTDFHDHGGFCAGPCGGNCTDPVLGRPDGGWNSFEDDADPADVRAYALAHSKGIRHGDAREAGERGIPAAAVPGAPADADSDGLARSPERHGEPQRGQAGHEQRRVDPLRRVLDWGNYAPAIHRWEAVLGRPAPRPTEPGRTGERLSPRFVEWMQGLPEGWVTDVPGLSRNAQLKALGNGVVPQQCVLALRILLERVSDVRAA